MKHYPLLSLIAFSPFFLIFLFSAHSRHAAARNLEHYATLSEEAFQELKRLDSEFIGLQKTYTLLASGEEKVMNPSLLHAYIKEERADSPFAEYDALKRYLKNIGDAVEILQARISSIGRQAIYVDLSEQKLALIESGMIIAKYPVSSGASDTPTPRGEFQIHRKQPLRISNLETPYRMPYYMAFTENQSHGLHALPYLGESPEDSDYWQEARSHIGIPVSHGCVRLLPEDAEKMYEWIEVGTKVIIHA